MLLGHFLSLVVMLVANSGVKNTPFSGSNYEARYLASSFWWSEKLNIRSAHLIGGSGAHLVSFKM
jgi:hypothetical protein